MLKAIKVADKAKFMEMMNKFYHSNAVIESVDKSNFEITFDMIINNSPYVEGYFLEIEDNIIGYCLFSITYSNEFGGLVIWLEELFVDDKYQGKGLGKLALKAINEKYKSKGLAMRLEVSPKNSSLIKFYENHGYSKRSYLQMYLEVKRELS